jgi:hypothetical protein
MPLFSPLFSREFRQFYGNLLLSSLRGKFAITEYLLRNETSVDRALDGFNPPIDRIRASLGNIT